jgi:hypothetical protein
MTASSNSFWAVLQEDTYETFLGDGYYAYVVGRYLSKDAAQSAIHSLSGAEGADAYRYRWHVRSYTLTRFGKTLEIAPAPTRTKPTTTRPGVSHFAG